MAGCWKQSNKKQKTGGRRSRSKRTEKKKKSRKWHQRGCQSGGGPAWGFGAGAGAGAGAGQGSGTGSGAGAALGANSAGTGAGSGAGIGALAGAAAGLPNHYGLNTNVSSPAQSSNHLVEKGFLGGSRRYGRRHGRHRHRRSSKHRRYIGEQSGGYAEYLPELANAHVRGAVEVPSNMFNSIQGASTAFKTSNPTVQPIGSPIQLL